MTKRIRVLLHLSAGGGLALVGALADHIFAQPAAWGPVQSLALAAGLGLAALGFFPRSPGARPAAAANLCLSLLVSFALIALGEVFFRAIAFDFDAAKTRAWRETPIYYRYPVIPTGEVFFRRPGPEQWTGQVLHARLRQLNIVPNPYADEPALTVEYDRRGFRNPEHLDNWAIAVAGDSFTELGYLAYDQLFTSVLAARLGVPVLNLGASHTGPLTYLSYLRDYGAAADTRHVLIVFFEGNDLKNLAREYQALARWRETGQRDYRAFGPQTSLLRALRGAALAMARPLLTRRARQRAHRPPITAYFAAAQGDIPVTLYYTPPGRSQVAQETLGHLDYLLARYADFGRERQVAAWLAYMPSKRRTLHGHLRFAPDATAELRDWRPTDLPELFAELCDQHGIGFIDLTPALTAATNSDKSLLYNSIYDSHLNARGALVVGRELARRFAGRSQ